MVRGDCEAAAKVQVESFDDKFLHAVGNEKQYVLQLHYQKTVFIQRQAGQAFITFYNTYNDRCIVCIV